MSTKVEVGEVEEDVEQLAESLHKINIQNSWKHKIKDTNFTTRYCPYS